MQVSVIGAGTMGAGIAYIAAAAGLTVRLHDADPAALLRGLGRATANVEGARTRGKLDAAAADRATALLDSAAADSVADAASEADVVIEAVVENMAVKQTLFRELEEAAPASAVLATNTSALSVTEIASSLRDPPRCVGMHFFNPVRSMPLCELVLGLETSDETVCVAEQAARTMDKETVRVRDVAGFATSRINAIIGNEAFFMLAEGVASAEDIDTAVRLGLNHPMGPLEMADMVGLEVRLAVLNELRRSLGDKYRPAPLMEQYVRAGRLGRKVGRGVYVYDEDGIRVADALA